MNGDDKKAEKFPFEWVYGDLIFQIKFLLLKRFWIGFRKFSLL